MANSRNASNQVDDNLALVMYSPNAHRADTKCKVDLLNVAHDGEETGTQLVVIKSRMSGKSSLPHDIKGHPSNKISFVAGQSLRWLRHRNSGDEHGIVAVLRSSNGQQHKTTGVR